LNVNTLNNNNNVGVSVVTPPRMNDLAMWYTADHIEHATDNSNLTVSHMYDRSGRGNHLTQTTGINQPFRGLSDTPANFGGKQVVKFTHAGGPAGRDDTYIFNADVDVVNIFGQFSAEQSDPEWSIAMVLCMRNLSVNSNICELDETGGIDYLTMRSTNNGAGFAIRGSGDTDTDTGDQVYSATTCCTMITTCIKSGTGTMFVYQWIAGVANDWDDTGIGTPYPVDPQYIFVDSTNNNSFTMGADTGAASKPAFVEVAEFMMWDSVLTGNELTETLNYLRDKWDCT
jgi:hypothetical protein